LSPAISKKRYDEEIFHLFFGCLGVFVGFSREGIVNGSLGLVIGFCFGGLVGMFFCGKVGFSFDGFVAGSFGLVIGDFIIFYIKS